MKAPVRENMQNETLAQAFVRYVHEDLLQIKQPHFDIAFRLHEAKRLNYPEELGYKDIYELAEMEFGFKRSSTAAYIAVCEEFMKSDKNFIDYQMQVNHLWTAFSFSQLVELLPMDYYDRRNITPNMTIKQIREWRRDHKFVTLANGDRVLYGELNDKQRKAYEEFKANGRFHSEEYDVESDHQVEGCSVQTSGQIGVVAFVDGKSCDGFYIPKADTVDSPIEGSHEVTAVRALAGLLSDGLNRFQHGNFVDTVGLANYLFDNGVKL